MLPSPVILSILAIGIIGTYFALRFRFSKMPKLPLGLFLAYFLVQLLLAIFQQTGIAAASLHWLEVLGYLLFVWACIRLGVYICFDVVPFFRRQKPFPAITKDFFLFLIYLVTAFLVMHWKTDINLVSLVTTSAALTLVAGFAAQSILSNLFSGLLLQIEKPFEIGDWIQCGNNQGRVEEINWKSTQLLTREHLLIHIPNAEVFSHTFINYSKPDRSLIATIDIGIDYAVPPNRVRKVVQEVVRAHPLVLADQPIEVWITGYGDFAVQYQIRFWHSRFSLSPQIQSDILVDLWYAFKRNEITIPFPIRDVRLAHIERKQEQQRLENERETLLHRLDAVPILAPLSLDDRTRLVQHLRFDRYAEGEYIVRQHEPGTSLHILHQGRCEVCVDTQPDHPVAYLEPGDYFGEISLLTGEPRTASVKALSDVVVLTIDKEMFSQLIRKNEDIFELMGKELAKRQSELEREKRFSADESHVSTSTWVSRIRSFFRMDPQK
ncbi:MAG: cyclic nucleotide-binding domain-containing protein [Thermodesulfobacteriota bacterium]